MCLICAYSSHRTPAAPGANTPENRIGIREAADGIRTHDLLHGNLTVQGDCHGLYSRVLRRSACNHARLDIGSQNQTVRREIRNRAPSVPRACRDFAAHYGLDISVRVG
jgi:hypothetical protein